MAVSRPSPELEIGSEAWYIARCREGQCSLPLSSSMHTKIVRQCKADCAHATSDEERIRQVTFTLQGRCPRGSPI